MCTLGQKRLIQVSVPINDRNDLNLAQMTFLLPSTLDVALQYKCLSQGFTHGCCSSLFPFSFVILLSNLVISVEIEQIRATSIHTLSKHNLNSVELD